jgi:predicted nucleotidyltransferase
MKSFITGSHAYGTPRLDSDVDLVVLISPHAAEILASHIPEEGWDGENHQVKNYGLPDEPKITNLVFGKLNLICLYNEKDFRNWKALTDDLIERAPVTREEAIEYMHANRTLM